MLKSHPLFFCKMCRHTSQDWCYRQVTELDFGRLSSENDKISFTAAQQTIQRKKPAQYHIWLKKCYILTLYTDISYLTDIMIMTLFTFELNHWSNDIYMAQIYPPTGIGKWCGNLGWTMMETPICFQSSTRVWGHMSFRLEKERQDSVLKKWSYLNKALLPVSLDLHGNTSTTFNMGLWEFCKPYCPPCPLTG